MGRQFEAICRACDQTFTASEGGGFSFEQLRCLKCGAATEISYEEIGEPYLAYLKGCNCFLPEPNGMDGSTYPCEPISEEEYRRAVEARVGACECGGRFAFDAPVRCPSCRSDQIDEGTTTMRYD